METVMFLAKVRPGQEDALDGVLAEIQKDFAGNPYLRLADSQSTHFARWNVIRDPDNGPRLLFLANFDGRLRDYLEELVSVGDGMDQIWGTCEGWRGREHLLDFVRETHCQLRGVHVSFPGLTVGQIQNFIAIREELECFLDLPDVARFLDDPGASSFLDRLAQVSPGPPLGSVLRNLLTSAGEDLRGAILARYLDLAKAFAQQDRAPDFPRVRAATPAGVNEQQLDLPVSRATVQNEMTVLSDVIPGKSARMQLGLLASVPLARYGFPPGQFANVGTLHWFGWSLIDNGKRLLFISTFDGSWQRYLQDFINKIVWAIDAVWGNTYDFPPAGMKDVVGYTNWIISHQHPARALYSAYPQETAMNLISDRRLCLEMGRAFDRPAVERWLKRL